METKVITDFRQELSERLSELIGYPLQAGWIVHDNPGFYYYIQNLQPGYPICVMDYHVAPGGRPQLMMVLPYADYQMLEKAERAVEEYIATAHFNFGYYWGGGSIYGAYWQPFGTEAGINEPEAIKRYLWQLACRTYVHSLGHKNPESHCTSCPLEAETCPHSCCNPERNWQSEIPELDGRKQLFQALKDRVRDELQFDTYSVLSHTGAKDTVDLYAGYKPNSVQIYASQDLLNELLYHPEIERDWAEVAKSLKFVRKHFFGSDVAAEIDPEMPDKHQACLTFWSKEMPSEADEVVRGSIPTPPIEGYTYAQSLSSRIADFVQERLRVARNMFRGR